MGEVIARASFTRRGIAADVSSAGTDAIAGIEATDGAQRTVRRLGLDLSRHLSQPVTADLVATSDLVVAMERRHIIDLVNDYGAALVTTYTLPELALLAGPAPRRPNEPLAGWLDRISEGRDAVAGLAAPEIDDPIGRPLRHYRTAARLISEALEQMFDAYEGFAPSR